MDDLIEAINRQTKVLQKILSRLEDIDHKVEINLSNALHDHEDLENVDWGSRRDLVFEALDSYKAVLTLDERGARKQLRRQILRLKDPYGDIQARMKFWGLKKIQGHPYLNIKIPKDPHEQRALHYELLNFGVEELPDLPVFQAPKNFKILTDRLKELGILPQVNATQRYDALRRLIRAAMRRKLIKGDEYISRFLTSPKRTSPKTIPLDFYTFKEILFALKSEGQI